MANDTQKSNNNHRIYIAIAVILLFAIINFAMRGCGNAGIEQLHKSTDSTVGTVEKQHETIGSELDIAGTELDSAGAAISRADQLITASQERVAENTAGLADCQRIVGECRKIVADSQRVYGEVEEANRSRTGSGGGS